jgi:hypothetical protein
MGKNWIASAIRSPGALRKKLGKKKGEKISSAELKPKKGDSAKTKKRKNLAKTLKSFR